jgi:group I intron endonuclease
MKISGIYKIINKVNGKYYVGSSYDICGKRWTDHKYKLNKNIHTNPKLQHAWNKYGKNNFCFLIEEQVSPENLLVVEQYHLNLCKNNPDFNYNISYDATAPMFGRKHTQETKQKMSKSHNFSPEDIEKMRLRRLGKKYSKETKQKMSEKASGKNHINYDHTIYNFFNTNTDETYNGTRFDFQSTFRLKQCSVSALMLGKMKSLFGWIVIYNQH